MFDNRYDAAEKLAHLLKSFKDKEDVMILAIPRGALEIGNYIAKKLNLPLDVIVSKKIAFPGESEVAIGAVCLGEAVYDEMIISRNNIKKGYIESQVKKLKAVVKARYQKYTGRQSFPKLIGKTAILVDDGIATGQTMFAAIKALKKQKVDKIIIAVPVAPESMHGPLSAVADQVYCLHYDPFFVAVGNYYKNFEQVEDKDAIRLLKEANQ